MTQNKKWKKAVRERAAKLGVPYREALRQLEASTNGQRENGAPAVLPAPEAPASAQPLVSEPSMRDLRFFDEKADYFTSDPTQSYTFQMQRGQVLVTRTVRVGMKCVVEPLNPQSTKHRGRVGIVSKLRHDYVGSPYRATLKFIDGKGPHGVVKIDDLRELTADEEAALDAGQWPPRMRRTAEDQERELARPSSLTQTSFSRADFNQRPPRADVQVLWDAAKPLDAPSLATDPSTEYLFKTLFPAELLDVERLAKTGVARWLPSYEEKPCTWWGSPRLADIYRLAVRGYEPDGTLGAVCAMANAEAVSVTTGEPISRSMVKWPRPWRTNGLLLADEAALAVLQGRKVETLKAIVIANNMLNFLGFCAIWGAPAGSSTPSFGIIGLTSGTHVEDLASVRWPEGVMAIYAADRARTDTRAVLKRLRKVLGPRVPIVDAAEMLRARAPKAER
ncbi:hypothetical protein ACN28E_55135 [Archangium lansingense]|uniref:hypothetical protein n=1 Tax=Archangium lansingense TaxID=2995310 RepID=UPI003B76CF1F